MKTREFCTNLNQELIDWRQKLQEVSGKFDAIASIDKYRLTTQIEGIHILLAEMEDRINELKNACPNGDWAAGEDYVGEPAYNFKEEKGVAYDYDFGG